MYQVPRTKNNVAAMPTSGAIMENEADMKSDLIIEGGGRAAQMSALVRSCLDQPESTSRALQVLLLAQPDNELARNAMEVADAVGRLYGARANSTSDIHELLSGTASGLLADDKIDEAADVLALGVRMGAEGDAVDSLRGEIASRVTQTMRDAMTAGIDATAERDAGILMALNSDSPEAWLVSGRLKLKQGLAEEARIDLERAADLAPQSQNTLLNFARAQLASGHHQSAVLTLFKLLRIADGTDGRYRPLATTELEATFNAIAQESVRAQSEGDNELVRRCLNLMEEIADGVSGSMIEYVAGARNCVRAAVGYARAAQAVGKGRRGLSACDAAMELEPDVAALWSTIARLRLHYNENAQAAQAFRQALEIDGEQASMRDGLAEALFRDGQLDAALVEAERAVAAAPGNRAIADRQSRISGARTARESASSMPDGLRHLAVLGMPNQGNAKLGCRIAEATGGAFVGESFWLAGQGIGDSGEPKFSSCQRCRRPDCETFTMAFRSGLTEGSGDWYGKIAGASGQKLLVSADNSAQIVRRLDPALICDAVIAYRSPASAWAVFKQHYSQQRRELPQLMQFLQTWYRTFSAALNEFPQKGALAPVNLDEIDGDGANQIDIILSGLGMERAATPNDVHHFFGVNASEVVGDFQSTEALIDDLPANETTIILSFTDGDELFKKLQAL
jgi:tetratricopeptide (TPR) repeat protein